MWVFPEIRVPQNGWFIMENPIKMDEMGCTTIFGNIHMYRIYLVVGFNPNEMLGQNENHFQVGYRRCSKPPRYEKISNVRDTLMYLYVIF